PFGHGRPFSRGQLNTLLREALFTPVWSGSGFVVPPGQTRASVAFAHLVDTLAGRWLTGVAAVVMATAIKEIYGVTPVGKVQPAVSFAEVVGGSSRQSGAHSRCVPPIFPEETPRQRQTGWPKGCRR
ncbi:MAG: hypothetical protein JXQ84_07445, partial [Rhodospirillaceae bacterium]|nr:hypothetical protein [Rhodospirillaceae bacterium]